MKDEEYDFFAEDDDQPDQSDWSAGDTRFAGTGTDTGASGGAGASAGTRASNARVPDLRASNPMPNAYRASVRNPGITGNPATPAKATPAPANTSVPAPTPATVTVTTPTTSAPAPVPLPPGEAGKRIHTGRETTYHAGHRAGGASRRFALAALLTGLIAIAVGVASAGHELAPDYLDPDGKVPGRFIAIACAVSIVATLVLVIIARATTPRRTSHRGVASGGIIAFVFASLLLALGVVVGVLFPSGLIRPNIRDEAPVNSADGMRFGIERVTGACTSGWKSPDVSGYPGVESAFLCTDTRVAYMTFDSETVADMYAGAVTGTIASTLEEHADDTRAQGDWYTLRAGRWLAFGTKENMTALQGEWGGTLASVDTSGASGTSASGASAAPATSQSSSSEVKSS